VSAKISKCGILTDVSLDGFHCRGRNGGFRGKQATVWPPGTALTDPYGDVILEVTSKNKSGSPPIQVGMSWDDAEAVRDALNEALVSRPVGHGLRCNQGVHLQQRRRGVYLSENYSNPEEGYQGGGHASHIP